MNLTKIHQHSRVKPQHGIILFLLLLFLIAPVSFARAQKQHLNELTESTVLVINSGLIWQHEKSKKIGNFMAMKNYVTEREIEGWRLPTKQELYELIEIFDLHQNGTINMDLEGSYWLTDDSGTPATGAWESGDQCGPSRTYYPHKRGYIRLVRKQ
jgi:hypothetical protein